MKKNITKEDVIALREELLRYAENAELHLFPLIIVLYENLNGTINKFEEMDLENLNAMYRVIYRIIGKDYSEYME